MALQFVYMTTGNLDEAQRIGETLVKEKLAACVNIIETMQSLYIWEDTLQKDHEVAMIAKTAAARVPELVERVKALHSYDCPCIVAFPIHGGNDDFLRWIGAAVRPDR